MPATVILIATFRHPNQVQHATRAKFVFFQFCKGEACTIVKLLMVVNVLWIRWRRYLDLQPVICASNRRIWLIRCAWRGLKSINEQLDRYDERIKQKLSKRREKESIDLPSKRVKEDVPNQP